MVKLTELKFNVKDKRRPRRKHQGKDEEGIEGIYGKANEDLKEPNVMKNNDRLKGSVVSCFDLSNGNVKIFAHHFPN